MAVTGFNNEEGKMTQQHVGTKYLPFYFESERPKRGATFKHVGPYTPPKISTLRP
jgi:hypothetical protein